MLKMLQKKGREHWAILLLSLILLTVLLSVIGTTQLVDWDECVFAQEAKEMVQNKDFLTYVWNGVRLFEKPPLTGWIISTSYLVGINEFSARLPAVIAGIALLLAVYAFGCKYFSKRTAFLSSLILLSSQFFVVYTLRINSDIFFTLFTFLGVFAWLQSSENQRYSYLSGLLFGIAVMSKGLSIAPYLLAIFVTTFIDFRWENIIAYIKMFAAFLLVILPWHLYEYLRYGQTFIQVYFIEHLIRRARVPLDFHIEGRLFYVKLTIQNFSLLLLSIFIYPLYYLVNVRKYKSWKSIYKEIVSQRVLLTLFIISALTFISITNVRTRIWWYVMPIYPYLALVFAQSIIFLIDRINKQKQILYLAMCVIVLFIAVKTIRGEISPQDPLSKGSQRNELFKQAAKEKDQEIYYLVWFAERQGRAVLPKEWQTSTTFVFGGNPCAVYYSNKRIHYIYMVEEFQRLLKTKKGLFAIENGDKWIIKDTKLSVVASNPDYTLFRIQ